MAARVLSRDMVQKLRYAFRQLRKNPTFTLVAVLSLALGIGATSCMFSVADALLLRPLPVPQPSQIVNVESSSLSDLHQRISWPDFKDIQARNRTFSSVVAYTDTAVGFKRQSDGLAHLTSAYLVSGSFFQDLNVEPQLGRAFRPDENAAPGRDPVAILAHEFWLAEFHGDHNVLGRQIRLNGTEFTIVGVAPSTFSGMDQFLRPQLFVPLAMAQTLGIDKLWDDRAARRLSVKGRLKPGISLARAQADLTSIAGSIGQSYPKTNRALTLRAATELQHRMDDSPSDTMLIILLMSLALCVLTVACANVAGLLFSRARARAKEIAVRLAIGASRPQLIGQLLLESALISLLGGVAGTIVAYAGVQYFGRIQMPTDLPMSLAVQVDPRMLVFTLAASLFSTVLFGLLPAFRNTKVDLVPSLKAADADSKNKQSLWGRNGLVIAQVAVSMLLLVVTGLLFRGFTDRLSAGPGYRINHLLMMSFDPSLVRYTPDQTRLFYKHLTEDAARITGVQNVALSYVVPMAPMQHGESLVPEGYPLAPGQESISVSGNIVDPEYFDVMGIPIVSGRAFAANDKLDSPKVAIINQVIAEKYFKGKDPVGRRIHLGDVNAPLAQIVGIAKTTKVFWVGEAPEAFLYLPFEQSPKTAMTLMVHSQGDASVLAAPLRKIIAQLDANQPVFDVQTMDHFYSKRVIAIVGIVLNAVAALGAMGLFLSMVGLYGVVAFSIGRRKREIGLRMAIGADRVTVLRMVLKQGLVLATAGVLIGFGLSFGVRPLVGSLVANQSAGVDLLTAAAVGVIMLLITLLATLAPARRASRIDPMRALRDE